MSTDLETRLCRTLQAKASTITEADLSLRPLDDLGVVGLVGSTASPRHRVLALACVVLVLFGLVAGAVLSRHGDTGGGMRAPFATPVDRAPGPSTARAWPLNGDEPLPGPLPATALQSPEAVAAAYLAEVFGAEWFVDDVVASGATTVVRYIRQDVPSAVSVARSADGLWYVTGASTELSSPGLPVETPGGVDVSVAPGPRTYESGSPVRLTALGADGRVLATQTSWVQPVDQGAAGAAPVVALRWAGSELAAAVRMDVLDDHDGNGATPDVVIGHWASAVAAPAAEGVPAGYDVTTAEAVFSAAGPVDDVAAAYVRARFPDYPAPGVTVEPARTRARMAFASWSAGSTTSPDATGLLVMRQSDAGWAVVTAVTAGVDLSDLHLEGGHLRGRITSDNINSLFADVLGMDGEPVVGSPRPGGYQGAASGLGTAAGPATATLDLDVEVGVEAPIVRVHLVGGTVLSVSELRMPSGEQ